MNSLLLLVASSTVGVSYGWQPLSTGGVEYIIQIEPQALESLANGRAVASELQPGLDVRRFRIIVGTDNLPQTPSPAPPPAAGPPANASGSLRTMPTPNQPTLAVRPTNDPSTFATTSPTSGDPATLTPIPQSALGLGGPTAGQQSPPLSAQMGSPRVQIPPPPALPPVAGTGGPPPANYVPPAESGPTLKSPSAIADSVADAFNDPNAPGRGAPAETAQPRLPSSEPIASPKAPRTLEPEPGAGQLADYKATPHEAQRHSDFKPTAERPAATRNEHAPEHNEAKHEHEKAAAASVAEPTEKPWGTLVAVVILLFLSASANVYLGWIAWDSWMRYQRLLSQNRAMPAAA